MVPPTVRVAHAAPRSLIRPLRAKSALLRQRSTARYPTPLAKIPRVDETECMGCNLCSLVCPVDECITMVRVDDGLTRGDMGSAHAWVECAVEPQQS